jgi:Tfp pilus assembly protein PilF
MSTQNHESQRNIMRRLPVGLGAAAAICLALVLTTFGCAPAEQEPAEVIEAAAPQVEEIPVTTASDTARGLFEEGEYLLDVGRNVAAREKFDAAVAEDPGFAYAYFNRSNVAGSFQAFQENLDRASENLEGKSEGERLLVEISRTFLTNDPEQGLELARQLTDAYPNSPRAWLALAGMQGNRNDNEAARVSAKKAHELDPKSVAAVLALANSTLRAEPKDFAKAEEYTRMAIELYPEEAKTYEMLGDVKRGQKDLEGALAAYNQATDTDPTLAVAQLKKGHVSSFVGNFDDARAAFDAAIEAARPENKASYSIYRAFTNIHAGDIPAALAELEGIAAQVEEMGTPADQVKGNQVFALSSHAIAALHHGMLDQAAKAIAQRAELQRAIGEDVGTEDAKRLQEADCAVWDGRLAAYQGNHDLAQAKAEEYATLVEGDQNPRKMEAYHLVMGLSNLQQADYAQAAEHLRQANHENNMYIRYQLAVAEEGVSNTDEAKRLFKEVSEFNFNSVGFALVGRDAAEKAAG